METKSAAPVEPQKPVTVKEKVKSRPAVVVLSVLFIAALIGGGVIAYGWMQEKQKTADAQSQLEATRKTIVDLNNTSIGSAKNDQTHEKTPDFGTFIQQYNNFYAAEVKNVDYAQEKVGIEAALKSYYKTDSLPEGWAVRVVYEVVKPETPATGDYYALVYWPQGEKPASFVSLIKIKGGEWKYDDLR